tara:strand:+ start:180496 stop:181677 length:1182 start_codon:yes stop_codon:yes gene_type:complete
MNEILLTLNAGSSSLKFAMFDADAASNRARMSGEVANIGRAPVFSAKDANGKVLDKGAMEKLDAASNHDLLIAKLLQWIAERHGDQKLVAVGHRVVHGGRQFSKPTRVTDAVLQELETLVPLAPLHQPHNLAAIRAVAKWKPDLPQIACFDTGFHHSQSRLAQLFALPRALSDEGIIRYGFHGLSYDYIAGVLPEYLGDQAGGRVIVAHLGNGASMCAMKNRQSVATSMGFTALDGLMMGSRCGTIDPGVLLYLLQAKGMDAGTIEDLLYRQSGLLGVSGISNDMSVLEQSDAPHARDAIDLFNYRAASILASLVPAIGGLDALVFTAGIGENSARTRQLICDQLDWLGVALEPAENDRNAALISAAKSRVKVFVVPTNEEAIVARDCRRFLS